MLLSFASFLTIALQHLVTRAQLDGKMSSEYGSDSEVEAPGVTEARYVKDNLRRCISSIQSAGSFATFGTVDSYPNPGISLDSIGVVPLPLSEENAIALTQESRKAPFGKRKRTIVDEEVRKTWEIDGSRITFLNEAWKNWLDGIVKRVANELGAAHAANGIRAELYKMLLYEEGAHFKAHKE